MNIELTQEQAEAFGRGESITLTPKPKQWEPKGGDWWVSHYGSIHAGGSITRTSKFGVERQTAEAAVKASAAMRTHNRLLAYVDEFGGDWEADWENMHQEKCYMYYGHNSSKRWKYASVLKTHIGGIVYMSQDCAKGLAAKLNSGEVVL